MSKKKDRINELLLYYGFVPIDKSERYFMPQVMRLIEHLHGFGKDFVTTNREE